MPLRTLQLDSETTINRLGFGAMGLSFAYGETNDEQSKATLRKAIEIGAIFWDTSNMYGFGHNEKIIGEVLKEGNNREKVFLVSKWGYVLKDPATFEMVIDGSAANCKAAFDKSVSDLGGLTPDAYLLHRTDPDTPIEESVKAMEELRKDGKIKFIGLSECSASTLRRASAIAEISFVEAEYSPWSLDIEQNGLLSACRDVGAKVIAYSPLGRGFLTGRYKTPEDFAKAGDYRGTAFPRFAEENFKKNYKIVEAFEQIAATKSCKPSQLALAWLLAQGDDIIPIPGTKSEKYLVENTAAVDVELTAEDVANLRKVIEENAPVGDRYAPSEMKRLNQ